MIEKIHIPMLCLAIISVVCYALYYGGSDYTASTCLQSMMTNLYLWIVVLAVIGCYKKYFNYDTPFTRYMTKSSFGIYILHYPVLITTCYILYFYFDFPPKCNYMIALVVEFVMTWVLYEIIRKIPFVRFIVLGVKRKA